VFPKNAGWNQTFALCVACYSNFEEGETDSPQTPVVFDYRVSTSYKKVNMLDIKYISQVFFIGIPSSHSIFMLYYVNYSLYFFSMIKHILFLFLFSLFLIPAAAHAGDPKLPVRDAGYAARYVSQSVADPVVIEAGATRDVTVTFRNTGTATWQSTGAYATAYTVDAKYRSSAFANTSWIKSSNPAKFASPVAPGETGMLTLSLTAPSTPGVYTEEFYLAVDNYTWMQGGYFYVKVQVVPATTAPAPVAPPSTPTPPPTTVSPAAPSATVTPFFISIRAVEAEGGVTRSLRVSYRNDGAARSNLSLVPVTAADSMFASESWQSASVISPVQDMAAGSIVVTDIEFNTPAVVGDYAFNLALAENGVIIPGTAFRMTASVTADAPPTYRAPSFAAVPAPISYRYETVPTIRVGIAKIDSGSMTIESSEDDLRIVSNGTVLGTLPRGTRATLTYNGRLYTLRATNLSFDSATFFRFEPATNPTAIVTLGGGFTRDITWKGRTVFNTYRGTIEFRVADDKEKTLYAINELPLDSYTLGVAEVSNSAPMEFLKAQAVAVRTYAHVIQGTRKYPDRYFDVVAHTGDQLYLGTAIEETTPNYIAAVQATRGEMVLYNDAPVLTPYFANSDGTTRSFSDAWGGATRPWLVPVRAEFDLGRVRFGHGVGMSQRDAMARAESGALYSDILKHYYTGVVVERMYE
jgi:hypothetical protein